MAKRKIKKCFQIFVYLHTYVHYTYIHIFSALPEENAYGFYIFLFRKKP